MLNSKRAETGSGLAEACQLEERVRVTEEDSDALLVASACENELPAERALLTAGSEQASPKSNPISTCINELEVAAETLNRMVGVVMAALDSSKGRLAAVEDRSSTSDAQPYDILDKMSELPALV